MTFFSFTAPFLVSRSLRHALLLMLSLPLLVSAQSGRVEAIFTPPSGWETGDPVELIINYGTQDNPIGEITSVQFEVQMPEGASIDPDCERDLDVSADNSWFAPDNNWAGTAELSGDGQVIIVSLIRTNQEPVSGFGEILRVKGLIVVIEEIMLKNEPELKAKVSMQSQLSELSMIVDQQAGLVRAYNAPSGSTLELLDLQGRVLANASAEEGLLMPSLPAQILWVRVRIGKQTLAVRAISGL